MNIGPSQPETVGAREQNRTADLLITNETGISAVLTQKTPASAGEPNERCAQNYLLWPGVQQVRIRAEG